MDISSINSMNTMYSDYIQNTASSQKTERMTQLAENGYGNATDDELMEVCKESETYFVEQVFKEMQKTVPESEYSSSSTSSLVNYFKDNMMQELAAQSTEQNSLGLAQMMYEQMKRNYEL